MPQIHNLLRLTNFLLKFTYYLINYPKIISVIVNVISTVI